MYEIVEIVRNFSSVYNGKEITIIVIDLPSEFWYEKYTMPVNCLSRMKGRCKVVKTHSYKYPIKPEIP